MRSSASRSTRVVPLLLVAVLVSLAVVSAHLLSVSTRVVTYERTGHSFGTVGSSTPAQDAGTSTIVLLPASESVPDAPTTTPIVHTPRYVETPEAVRAVYMTACVAGTPSLRGGLVKLIEETDLNALIIDVKDYTGTISFDIEGVDLLGERGTGCRVRDMREFVAELHEKGIYVIARITVFQDPLYANAHPDQAVQKASDRSVWTDYKGISFVEAGSREYWDYIVELSRATYALGFDELNLDYIRFPSDGNMRDIYYPLSEETLLADPDLGKATVVREFFRHVYDELHGTGPILSADIFGMTTTNVDDLNIGQILEYTVPYFDYVAPMVYPSHYPSGFNGYTDVNAHTYDIIKFSMDRAVERIEAMARATTTDYGGHGNYDPDQLRPWLQDFDYPVTYTPDMVANQIRATYDAGLDSWMLWDPSNRYTHSVMHDLSALMPGAEAVVEPDVATTTGP